MEAQIISRYKALDKLAMTQAELDSIVGPSSQANAPFAADYAQNEDLRKRTGQLMANLILTAAGSGALIRGGVGAYHWFNQPALPYTPSPSVTRVGLHMPGTEKDKKREKESSDPASSGLGKAIYESLLRVSPQEFTAPQGVLPSFPGANASTPWGVPAMGAIGMPAAVLAGLAAYGGTDMALNALQARERKQKVEKAKQQYEHLISEDFAKMSSDQMLDDLYSNMEKLAERLPGPQQPPALVGAAIPTESVPGYNNTAGAFTGVGLGAAALISALSGILGYNYFSKRTERAMTERALARRARARTGGIPPMYAEPNTDGDV